jgi:hypothetical protein
MSMKSKQQKRREAIERLERPVAVNRYYANNRELAEIVQTKRRAEAKRLREQFSLT